MQFIWNQVSDKWLYPADIFALTVTSKFMYKINFLFVYKNIEKIIKQKLALYIQHPTIFLNKLIYHKHYLSGSFLLQCLIGEDWLDSDIDCYFIANESCKSYNKQGDDILAHDFSHDLLMDGQVDTGIPLTYTGLPVYSYHYRIMNNVEKFLNLIQIKAEVLSNIFKYVSQICDFQFTKLIFDGKNLFVYDWNSIIERRTIVNVDMKKREAESLTQYCDKYYLHRIITRMTKYKERGFYLEFNSEMERNYLFNHITKCDGKNHFNCECEEDPEPTSLIIGDEKNYLIHEAKGTQGHCPTGIKKDKEEILKLVELFENECYNHYVDNGDNDIRFICSRLDKRIAIKRNRFKKQMLKNNYFIL